MSFMKKWIEIEELQKGQNMLVINWIIPKKKKKNCFKARLNWQNMVLKIVGRKW